MSKPSPVEVATKIHTLAKEYGCSVEVRGSILTVTKRFTPGDKAAYCVAESDVGSIIYSLPSTSAGSTWGSDSGSVGGYIGLTNGEMKLNKSGGSKRVLAALSKLL